MRRPQPQVAAAVAALGLTWLCGACAGPGAPGRGSAAGTITIGAIYPLSGPQGGGGTSEEQGAALAARWVNEHGGVDARQVVLETIDTPTAESVPAAMARLQADHVRLVLGTHGSTMSAVAAVEAQRRHMLLWETGAVGEQEMTGGSAAGPSGADGWGTGGSAAGPSGAGEWSTGATGASSPDGWGTDATGPSPVTGMGRTFFRMAPQGASLGRAGIDFVLRELAPKLPGHPLLRVAVAYVDDVYGQAVAEGVVDQVRADHVVLAGVFAYPEYGANLVQVAEAVKRSGANVLYASSYLADGEALRRATISLHLHLVASVGTSSSYCLPEFGDQLQGEAVGLFASDKPSAGSINERGLLPAGRQTLLWAREEWARSYGGQMDAYATSGFANALALLRYVLPRAAGLSPAQVAAAATRVKLPIGTLADG